MAKRHLEVVRSKMPLEEIARALRISTEDAIEKFKDPRVASWFAEIWVRRCSGFGATQVAIIQGQMPSLFSVP